MSIAWRVPGRIEVLGKHTDYAGGRVLVCALDRGVTVEATPGGSAVVARTDAFGDEVVLRAGEDPGLPEGHWGRYVQTVLDRLTANFGPIAPCRLEISSDLPPASGMSSSSALLCGVALALADANGFSETDLWRAHCPDRLALAGYLACVENGSSWGELAGSTGVGTRGGSEDHTAMLCGRPGALVQAEFDPMGLVDWVEVPAGQAFVVAVSGVLAEKTGPARELYNGASRSASEVLRRWNAASGRADASVAAAARSLNPNWPTPPESAAWDPLRAAVADSPALLRRLDHFLTESCFLVPSAAAALASGHLDAFGLLADESQAAAETLLGNQVPETVRLAASARAMGAHAASAFGAGFGGSVWALVDAPAADAFAADWLAAYRAKCGDHPLASVIVTRPGAAASRL